MIALRKGEQMAEDGSSATSESVSGLSLTPLPPSASPDTLQMAPSIALDELSQMHAETR
jgi:hypothetical protein